MAATTGKKSSAPKIPLFAQKKAEVVITTLRQDKQTSNPIKFTTILV